jgi:hypothetical protein
MRELFKPALVVPALILAEVCIPFSVVLAPEQYWRPKPPTLELVISILLGLVLVMYIIVESIRHASLLSGAIAGLWAVIIGTWPTLIIEKASSSTMGVYWEPNMLWSGILRAVPEMLAYAGVGAVAGIVFSAIPWFLRRRKPHPVSETTRTPCSGWYLVAAIVLAVTPLLASLGVCHQVSLAMSNYAEGIRLPARALTALGVETVLRIGLLLLAIVTAYLVLMRGPAVRPFAFSLFALAITAAAFRLATAANRPLSANDVAGFIITALAAGLVIPYLLFHRQGATARTDS